MKKSPGAGLFCRLVGPLAGGGTTRRLRARLSGFGLEVAGVVALVQLRRIAGDAVADTARYGGRAAICAARAARSCARVCRGGRACRRKSTLAARTTPDRADGDEVVGPGRIRCRRDGVDTRVAASPPGEARCVFNLVGRRIEMAEARRDPVLRGCQTSRTAFGAPAASSEAKRRTFANKQDRAGIEDRIGWTAAVHRAGFSSWVHREKPELNGPVPDLISQACIGACGEAPNALRMSGFWRSASPMIGCSDGLPRPNSFRGRAG